PPPKNLPPQRHKGGRMPPFGIPRITYSCSVLPWFLPGMDHPVIGRSVVYVLLSPQQPIHRHIQDFCQSVQLKIADRPLLALQKREGRVADVHALCLEFGQQILQLHPTPHSCFRYPRSYHIPVSQRQLSCSQAFTPTS